MEEVKIMGRKNSNLLTPEHACWDDFIEKLEKTSKCNHNFDASVCIIIYDFAEIDLFDTIMFFKESGAGCDCEVLLSFKPESRGLKVAL
jgi:hypothetical protein